MPFVPNYDYKLLEEAEYAFCNWFNSVCSNKDSPYLFADGFIFFRNIDGERGVYYNVDKMKFGFFIELNDAVEDKVCEHDNAKDLLNKWLWESGKVSLVVNPENGSLYFLCHKFKNKCFESYLIQRKKAAKCKNGEYVYDMVPLKGPIQNDLNRLLI